MTNISLYDFSNLHNANFTLEAKRRVGQIIDENSYIEGEWNNLFEKEFAEMQKAPFCCLVANGTDALEISLQANDIKRGDYVGVPGITFYATAEAIINVGAIPVFIDVDPETGLLSIKSLINILEKYPLKGIIPVHIYGLPLPMEDLEQVCRSKNVFIIEDAAQACGTQLTSGPVGSRPDSLTTFSFYPTKNLSAMGDAGAILTHSKTMANKIRSIRNHGRGGEGVVGRNSRCDHFQAAILHLKLKDIEAQNQQRKEIASWYHRHLEESDVKLLPKKYLKTSSWHLYPVRLKTREQARKLSNHLNSKGIATSVNFYDKALGQETALNDYPGERLNAANFAGTILCLPITPFLKEAAVKQISREIISCPS